ncbi:MAG: glycine--tRNA ligase [Nanoarchaeota archaeon]|nr:glycine--tRNA ligase [Nanoarchaeota archaeon]
MPGGDKPSIIELAKRRGFFWPAFEIYGGAGGFYEYGPVGTLLKLRIENMIRDYYVIHENCLLFEAPILTIEQLWATSGHLENFGDVTIECEQCGEPYRADHLLEENTKKQAEGLSPAQLAKELAAAKVKCRKCGGKLGKPYDYNLMFRTTIGPGKNKLGGALRPETAQTTYVAFKRLAAMARQTLPFGVLQMGKSFRNEISPRKAIIRLREFSQAEIQFFLDPKTKNNHPNFASMKKRTIPVLKKQDQIKGKTTATSLMINELVTKKCTSEFIAYYLARSVELFLNMGIDKKRLRLRQHRDDERSFYSSDTWDVEFLSDEFGVIELVGIADRTDYDLTRHQDTTKTDMSIDVDGKKIVPQVIEIAYGIDRPLYCVLESCYKKEKDRGVLMLPPALAPYQVAVFPLVKKDGLPKIAKDIVKELKEAGFYTIYDEGFIGKVYYRQDEIGTLAAVTIDYNTKKDKTITVRDRNTKAQVRVPRSKIVSVITNLLAGADLKKLGKAV